MRHDMGFMADGCGLPKKDLELARRVLDGLDAVGSHSMTHYAEAARVLSLSVPLATVIYHGLVGKVTPDGRDELEQTADTLEIMTRVSAEHPNVSTRELWDHVDRARKDRSS